MNEIEIEEFDYSIVDDKTASFLKLKEQEMQTIVLNNSIQLGEKLIEAQEKLARFNKGTFEKWFVSIGLKKQTVYNYINQAKFVHQMDESTQIEMFQGLPTSLKTEVSKPSVKPEIAEAIMNGDVKTKKEVEELKKQLKAKDNQIQMQAKMIDDLQEQGPQVIEKEVVVEKVPDDYDFFKNSARISEQQVVKAAKMVREANEENEQLKKQLEQSQEELQSKIHLESEELEQAQLARLQRDANISVHKLIINLNDFVKEQSVTVYDSQAIAGADSDTKNKLGDAVKRVESLLKDIKQEIGGEVTWIIN